MDVNQLMPYETIFDKTIRTSRQGLHSNAGTHYKYLNVRKCGKVIVEPRELIKIVIVKEMIETKPP